MKRPSAVLAAVAMAVGLTLTPAAAALSPADPASSAPSDSRLQRLVDGIVAAGAPGASLVVLDGSTSRRITSGVSDLDSQRGLRSGDVFRAGSVTKTFVATLTLQLVGDGRLRLDAPVARYLPGLLPDRGNVTVRQLLNHTSGLFDYSVDPAFSQALFRGEAFTPRQLVTVSTGHPVLGEPGAAFSYSNTNYVVLGMLVRKVGESSLVSQLEQRILAPLGLQHTAFPVVETRLRGPHVHGYVGDPPGQLTDTTTLLNPSWAWAAGALVSNVTDLARFYRALLDGRLIGSGLLREMRTTVPLAPGIGYGLGLASTSQSCGRAWGHDGLYPGYFDQALSSPDGRRQVVLMMNVDPLNGTPPANVLRAFRKALDVAFCAGRS